MSKWYSRGNSPGSGWRQYRYGTKKASPRKPRPILKGQERESAIQKVMDVMDDWRLSPFEREGATVAGLRSALCLKGYAWERSHHEATALVDETLRRLRAVRPTWEQGQLEYSVDRENCAWCSGPIPEELLAGGVKRFHSYCSHACARAAIDQRSLQQRRRDNRAFKDAWDVLQRPEGVSQNCAWCDKLYRPLFGRGKFCSLQCSSASQRVSPTRPCLHCSKPFIAHKRRDGTRQVFCNAACKNLHGFTTTYEKVCDCCAEPFTAKLDRARYCSAECKRVKDLLDAGGKPKRLTPKIFDYFMRMAA
jgi:hypothetical protein